MQAREMVKVVKLWEGDEIKALATRERKRVRVRRDGGVTGCMIW